MPEDKSRDKIKIKNLKRLISLWGFELIVFLEIICCCDVDEFCFFEKCQKRKNSNRLFDKTMTMIIKISLISI